MATQPVTVPALLDKKNKGEKICMITAYDWTFARIVDRAGVDVVLVGDSLAMVVQGHGTSLPATMDQMLYHTGMVARGVERALVVGDMPFLSYQVSVEEAVRNAGRFVAEGGAQSVKLEGSAEKFGDEIRAILRAGIPVMGHLGLTPQSIHQIGGHKVQGRTEDARARLKHEAQALEAVGCFALVLECIPADLAKEIACALAIPTIGIGAGAACDGQVLVMHDMLGFGKPKKMAKVFGDVRGAMQQAFEAYVKDVKTRTFPAREHEFE